MNCHKCIHHVGRIVDNGKLRWGSYCTYLVYSEDSAPVEIKEGFECPQKLDGQMEFNFKKGGN